MPKISPQTDTEENLSKAKKLKNDENCKKDQEKLDEKQTEILVSPSQKKLKKKKKSSHSDEEKDPEELNKKEKKLTLKSEDDKGDEKEDDLGVNFSKYSSAINWVLLKMSSYGNEKECNL